jgi:hypothetical protein
LNFKRHHAHISLDYMREVFVTMHASHMCRKGNSMKVKTLCIHDDTLATIYI